MSDVVERNIAKLVKQAALPDGERRAAAKAAFLRELQPASPIPRRIAVAAAVLVFGAVLYGTTRRALPPSPIAPDRESVAKQNEPAWIELKGHDPRTGGGNGPIQGTLRVSRRPIRNGQQVIEFKGSTTLPEDCCIRIRPVVGEQQLKGGVLATEPRALGNGQELVRKGRFEFEQLLPSPGLIVLEFDVPDALQHQPVLDQIKIPEAKRVCIYSYFSWDAALLERLEPQLAELADLAREARDLVDRVEAACAAEGTFKEHEKKLTAEAAKLNARAEGLARNGLVPAAAHHLAYTLRDLGTSMSMFKWLQGRFEGPSSYYTDGKPAKLHRGDVFSFDALRRYLDTAVLISGREFDLWILGDHERAGASPQLAAAVALSEKRPGVAEFAAALKTLPASRDETTIKLEDQIRQIPK